MIGSIQVDASYYTTKEMPAIVQQLQQPQSNYQGQPAANNYQQPAQNYTQSPVTNQPQQGFNQQPAQNYQPGAFRRNHLCQKKLICSCQN